LLSRRGRCRRDCREREKPPNKPNQKNLAYPPLKITIYQRRPLLRGVPLQEKPHQKPVTRLLPKQSKKAGKEGGGVYGKPTQKLERGWEEI